jgi:hypothetical protein
VNDSLLDTDIRSEIGKAIDPVVARNGTIHRKAFGRYTFSEVSGVEVIRGFQRKQSFSPPASLRRVTSQHGNQGSGDIILNYRQNFGMVSPGPVERNPSQ